MIAEEPDKPAWRGMFVSYESRKPGPLYVRPRWLHCCQKWLQVACGREHVSGMAPVIGTCTKAPGKILPHRTFHQITKDVGKDKAAGLAWFGIWQLAIAQSMCGLSSSYCAVSGRLFHTETHGVRQN